MPDDKPLQSVTENANVDAGLAGQLTLRRFSSENPSHEDCKWIVFVNPEDPARWVIGWADMYHVREEGGPSYKYGDPRLTWWLPLPDVPASAKKVEKHND